jgi:hypothetical protein
LLQRADRVAGDRLARHLGALDQLTVLGLLPGGARGDARLGDIHEHRLLVADGPPIGAVHVDDQGRRRDQGERDGDEDGQESALHCLPRL